MTTSVYWDSCVFIDFHNQTAGRIHEIRSVLGEAQAGNIQIVISAMVIAETTKCPQSPVPPAHHLQHIKELFRKTFIVVRPVDRNIAQQAVTLGLAHGIKPPDAIHLATALDMKVRELHTYDGVHLIPLSGKIQGLTICKPDHKSLGPLFNQ